MSDLLTESPPLVPEDVRLVRAYEAIGRPTDDLPYSPDFDEFVARVRREGDTRSEHELMQRLLRLRKAARLPRATRPSRLVGEFPPDDVALAQDLLKKKIGIVASRDQLPYTQEFEDLWGEFLQTATRKLDRHDFWRLIARISK
jgi:hypothetical protein